LDTPSYSSKMVRPPVRLAVSGLTYLICLMKVIIFHQKSFMKIEEWKCCLRLLDRSIASTQKSRSLKCTV